MKKIVCLLMVLSMVLMLLAGCGQPEADLYLSLIHICTGNIGSAKLILNLEHRSIPPSFHHCRPYSILSFVKTPCFIFNPDITLYE